LIYALILLIAKETVKCAGVNRFIGDYVMNKTDLISVIADKFSLTRSRAGEVIDAIFDSITKALARGDTFQLIGFGSFSVKKRAARVGRNPATGAEIKIPASKVPHFKAGAKLKEAVSKKK
jgi:DNA-binding protein HU-beta